MAVADVSLVKMEVKCNTIMRFLCGRLRGDPPARFSFFHFSVEIVDRFFFFTSTFKSEQIVFSSVWSKLSFRVFGVDVCVSVCVGCSGDGAT